MENFKIIHQELTKREVEVLECLVAGLCNKEIAQKLYISEATVNNHRASINKKVSILNFYRFVLTISKTGTDNLQ